ncbi:hypothetical protein DFH27DRAFT_649808 [Peziza echinospora]|nr:hypothetical protein DFH27DRAFT_649808 [Peziza echinospora]
MYKYKNTSNSPMARDDKRGKESGNNAETLPMSIRSPPWLERRKPIWARKQDTVSPASTNTLKSPSDRPNPCQLKGEKRLGMAPFERGSGGGSQKLSILPESSDTLQFTSNSPPKPILYVDLTSPEPSSPPVTIEIEPPFMPETPESNKEDIEMRSPPLHCPTIHRYPSLSNRASSRDKPPIRIKTTFNMCNDNSMNSPSSPYRDREDYHGGYETQDSTFNPTSPASAVPTPTSAVRSRTMSPGRKGFPTLRKRLMVGDIDIIPTLDLPASTHASETVGECDRKPERLQKPGFLPRIPSWAREQLPTTNIPIPQPNLMSDQQPAAYPKLPSPKQHSYRSFDIPPLKSPPDALQTLKSPSQPLTPISPEQPTLFSCPDSEPTLRGETSAPLELKQEGYPHLSNFVSTVFSYPPTPNCLLADTGTPSSPSIHTGLPSPSTSNAAPPPPEPDIQKAFEQIREFLESYTLPGSSPRALLNELWDDKHALWFLEDPAGEDVSLPEDHMGECNIGCGQGIQVVGGGASCSSSSSSSGSRKTSNATIDPKLLSLALWATVKFVGVKEGSLITEVLKGVAHFLVEWIRTDSPEK